MFQPGFDFTVHNSICDENGHYIILDLSIYEHRFTFVCLYGYNTDEPSFLSELLQKVASFSNTSLMFVGDWNLVQDHSIDTYNILHNRNSNTRKKLEEMIESLGLLDPWITCYSDTRKYTWRQCSPIKQSS